MTNLEITLSIILSISLLINVGLGVYARAAIVRLLSVADELYDLREMSNSLVNHLQSIYEMELFYGDETLKSLMDHSRSFADQMDTFEYIFGLVEEDDITTTEEDETETS